ncbi:beta-N-acetylhexosaminidase [Sporobolomyces salmoneus]|uniref:beta-N-acetylhexosaminidase n=1 Tax=Sporobolomyces salmoneus TaxID=183962 RepID=UPI00317F9A68
MASDASPLASLSQVLPSPLLVRPSVPQRTASSRSLPTKSTLPRITLAFTRVPQELKHGVEELARGAVRSNMVVTDDVSSSLPHVWGVEFEKREDLRPGAMKISSNSDDFVNLPQGVSRFVITISYNRPIEAFRGIGHVLAVSRSLASFALPRNVSERPRDSPMDEDPNPLGENGGSQGTNGDSRSGTPQTAEVKWSSKVGDQLRRDEQCLFKTVGVMIDCSRNGVLNVKGVKWLLRNMAQTGCNMLQLYCEDTYQIRGEPFFGYFRGPYTEDELREIDDYAFALGIEVMPCIQTLGHLGQMLQWPKFGTLRDTAEVLLAESAETYAFIEKMIKAISGPLRSRRVHIGQDEAHGVSEGRYRQLFGYKDSTKVFTDHLRRVNDICRNNGLEPMIWSDMLFCLPAKNNQLSGYYDLNAVVTQDLTDSIPPDLSVVYWSYYHVDSRVYTAKIAQHWQLAGKAPFMASGIWTWSRFWTALPFTFATVKALMKASKDPSAGIEHVQTTIWGDEGNEFDLYSALPGILYKAELAYTREDEVDTALFRRKFDGIVGGDLDDYIYASKLDDTQPESQPIDNKTHYTPNIAKYLLWEEPFYSFLSPQYQGYDLESHYTHLATYLEQALSSDFSSMTSISLPHSVDDYPANKRLQLPYLLASILSLKCHLRERLVNAYKADDRVELEALGGKAANTRMNRLRSLVKQLHSLHRSNWFDLYKPFGCEVLDLRYGGLITRLETMHERIIAYLDPTDDSVTKLEELEVELETIYPGQGANLMLDYNRCSRPQYI